MRQTTAWQIPYPETSDHTRTWEYWQAIAERVDTCLTTINNIVKAKELYTWSSTFTFPNAATSDQLTVTFPAGRFTATPSVNGWATSSWYLLRINAVSATAVTMSSKWDNAVATSSPAVYNLVAANCPSTAPTTARAVAAPAIPLDDDGVPATEHHAVCHTPGCENADIEIPVWLWAGTRLECGPCGQPITDVINA